MVHPLFRIDKVSEELLDMRALSRLKIETLEKEKLSFEFKYDITSNENSDDVEVFVHFLYEYPIDDNEYKPIFHYDARLFMWIKDYKKVVDDAKFGPFIQHTIVSIAYSTLRGMIAIRVMGHPLENFPIPAIDPDAVIKAMKEGRKDISV